MERPAVKSEVEVVGLVERSLPYEFVSGCLGERDRKGLLECTDSGTRVKPTLLSASAHALTRTPNVKITTEKICSGVYFLPLMAPAHMVVTLPKLRRMI